VGAGLPGRLRWALLTVVLVVLAAAATGCGGDEDSASSAAPGTPGNPLVAEPSEAVAAGVRSNEAAGAAPGQQPGYQELVDKQSSSPRSSFTPCNLVSAGQARDIVGAALEPPLEAPQGPTCIYRSRDGRHFVTLAVQPLDFATIKRDMRKGRQVAVAGRSGYCGVHGQPVLYVPISGGRVLSVAGPCALALEFATTAVERLPS
jgi:hypothetical protein